MARSILPPWCRIVRTAPAVYEREAFGNPAIRSPRDAASFVRPTLEREETEAVVVIALNTQHVAIAATVVTRGLLNSSLIHPREVFRVAIALNAAAIIVAHNHPSGDPTPSGDDRAVTNQLVAAGRLLDIPVHDHIIIGAGHRFTSFAEAGLL